MKSMLKVQNVQKIKILGQGTYGKCYLVKNLIDSQLCVLKQIQVGGMNEDQIEETIKEARILQALDHPCIIKCIQAYVQNGILNIFMDYADAGDLSIKIKSAKGSYFSENQILNWFTQICLALKHVHDRKVIHRDLKCQNIFLTGQNLVKLGDFGIAKPLQMTLQKIKTAVGTPYYMSPQICQNKQYSLKTDIWSLGVILYEMCALKPPFDANSLPALALKISRCEYGALPSHYSKELKRLLSDLLQMQPSRRPSINQILKYSLVRPRIENFLPQGIRQREFSHTTLHSQNIFQRQDLKREIRILTQQSQLSSIVSPKSQNGSNNFFSNQNSHNHKSSILVSSKLKQANSNIKDKNHLDKKKKGDLRKREISEPCLTPKSNQRKLKSNVSLTNLQRKKSQKDKNNFFKKKKIQNSEFEDYQTHLSEIKQLVGQVKQMHEHLSSDRQKSEVKSSRPKLVNNFIKQEESEQTSSSEEQREPQDEQTLLEGLKWSTANKNQTNCLGLTLEQLLIEMMGERQLSKTYSQIEENHGFVLGQNQASHLNNQGLVSLLYGINKLMAT